MRLCRTISAVKKQYVMLSLITSAVGWKIIFRKQMLNKIFWDGSINVIKFHDNQISTEKLYVLLSLITSALGWKTIFRK